MRLQSNLVYYRFYLNDHVTQLVRRWREKEKWIQSNLHFFVYFYVFTRIDFLSKVICVATSKTPLTIAHQVYMLLACSMWSVCANVSVGTVHGLGATNVANGFAGVTTLWRVRTIKVTGMRDLKQRRCEVKFSDLRKSSLKVVYNRIKMATKTKMAKFLNL